MKSLTKKLTESAIMIAIATVLSMIKLADMPYGGSVTIASMAPIVFVAYRYGIAWGTMTGFVASLVQALLGASSLSYATSIGAFIAILLLDYLIAFTVFGLAGMFRKMKDQTTGMVLATVLCSVLRYVCHVISGCTVWAGISIPTADGLIYSLVYNAAYMVPETVVLTLAVLYLSRVLDFRSAALTTKAVEKKSFALDAVQLFAILAALAYDFISVFASIQTEAGFDITGIVNAPWLIIGIVSGAAVVVLAVCQLLKRK